MKMEMKERIKIFRVISWPRCEEYLLGTSNGDDRSIGYGIIRQGIAFLFLT